MSSGTGCKVERVIETYGLGTADPVYDTIDEGLLARWTGAGDRAAMGYRSLTEWFNKRLLKQVYDEHGRETLAARLDSEYDILRGDDSLAVDELHESLRVDGIDPGAVEADMVSWGTMRTHLKECLDGQKEPPAASTDWEVTSVEKAKAVAADKTASAVSSLATKGTIRGAADARIEVQVQLGCDSCPTRVPFEVALDRGYVCEKHSPEVPGH